MKLKFAFLLALLAISTHGFSRSADEVTPLLIGSPVPKVTLADQNGDNAELNSLTKGNYSILVFYRGGWCPYCNTQLQELAQIEPMLVQLGYQIVGISPDSPSMLSSVEKDGELAYQLLSDEDLSAASAFGIDFTVGKATLMKYKTFGIDLEKSSGGKNRDKLPVPAVFIVTPDNKIAFSYVNPNYKDRVPGDLLLAAAKALKK